MQKIDSKGPRKRKLDEKVLSNAKRFVKEKKDTQKPSEDSVIINQSSTPTAPQTTANNEPIRKKIRKPRHESVEGQKFLKAKAAKAKAELEASFSFNPNSINNSKKRSNSNNLSQVSSNSKVDGDQEPPKKKSKSKKKSKKNKNKNKNNPQDPTGSKHLETEERYRREALAYLQLWKAHRDHWKFGKLKQVWLLKNALSAELVDENQFAILLEYMNSIKGTAKDKTLKDMQTIMTTFETKFARGDVTSRLMGILKKPEKRKEPTEAETTEYERARQIVQTLSDN